MADPLVNDDDLDSTFVQDPDILANGGNIQIVAKVKPVITPPVKVGPSVSQLIATKLVEIKNNHTKITNLRDVHDSIVAAESVCRSDAESIHLATESFLTPRFSINGFTDVRSSINFKESDAYLKSKISELEATNKAIASSIATESVTEYATSIIGKNTVNHSNIALHENIEKSTKGIFIAKDKEMVNISTESISKLKEFIQGATVPNELKLALEQLFNIDNTRLVLKFINIRMSVENVDAAINILRVKYTSEDAEACDTILNVTEYLTKYLAQDHDDIYSMYNWSKGDVVNTIDAVKKSTDDTEQFVNTVNKAMAHFETTELLEELLFKIPLFVAVINKLIDTAKF